MRALTLELSGGVTFYTRNDDYFGDKTLDQDPVNSTQAHVTTTLAKACGAPLTERTITEGKRKLTACAGMIYRGILVWEAP